MTEVQHSPLNGRLEDLRSEHRALDHELKNIADDPLIDDLQVQRLKKRKLFLNLMMSTNTSGVSSCKVDTCV
jgi:hypothetical protein